MNTPNAIHRGAQGAGRQAWRLSPVCLAICLLGLHGATRALPQGGQVVQGQAGIQTKTPGQMDIQQSTDKAIINWQGFSIHLGEVVRVQQPGANSVLLNRVTGVDPSLIDGQLQANGQVFLLNPRGVVFGKGSQIDAGGFMASTLGLSDTQFMAGQYSLAAGPETPGALQADGRISAPGGTVALVAPQLSVGGSIDARRVGLAAAGSALVDVEGDGLVLFNVRTDQLDTRLNFTGRIQADGGSAELRAQARAGFADTVLNMDGVVQARALGQREGRIVIDGGTAGITQVSGTLDASGQNAGEQGGSIAVLGQKVGLFDHALLDASGAAGGGTALVGGNFHGAGPEHNAERTYLSADATVRADALTLGNGGQVAVWSDQRTDVYGHISARGGALGGNGGAVETSGKQTLNMPMGGVDVSAPQGRAGSWLLDPNDITISNGAASTDTRITSSGTPTNVLLDSSGNNATLSTTTLNAALSSGATVTVTTQSAAGGGAAGNGDIAVDGTVAPAASNATLNLVAQHNIAFSATGNISATGANLTVNLKAGTDVGATNTPGTNTSAITMDAASSINTGGGSLTATAKGDIQLSTVTAGSLTVNSLGGNISQTTALPAQHLSVTGATVLNAGAGSITLTQANNDFQGPLTLTGATSQVTDTNALTLGTVNTGALTLISSGALNLGKGTVTGALNANSGGGDISQSTTLPADHLTVTGTSTLNAGAGAITLTQGGNDFQGALTLTGGTSQVTDTNALTLDTVNTGDLTLISGGALNLGKGTVSGALNATSNGGDISQSTTLPADHLTVTGVSTVDAGAGAITLTQATNDFQAALTLTGAISQVTDTNALRLGTVTTGDLTLISSGALNLGKGTVTGALNATSNGGAISQSTTLPADQLTVTGTSTLNAGAGTITLTQAGNDFQDVLTITGGTTQVTDTNALTLGTLNTGALTINSGGTLNLGKGTVAGALNATSNGGAIGQSTALPADHLTVTGTSTLNAGAGAITLTQGGNDFQGALTLTGATSQVTDTNALTLGTVTTGDLTLISTGGLNLGKGTVTGALNATSNNGTISQSTTSSDHLSVTGVTAATVLDAGTGAINLSQTGNAFGGTASLTGGAIAVTASGTLNVTTLSQAGSNQALALEAGTLQLPGPTFSVDTGTANLSLKSLASTMATTGTLTGQNVTLQGGTGLSVANAITAHGQLTLLSGSGPITQTAALNVAGPTTVDAGSGDITLTHAGNSLAQAVSLTGANTQIASSGALTLGALATGNLNATAHGALNLGQGTVTGTLNATSNNGAISQSTTSGDRLRVTGVTAATVLNAGTGDINLPQTGNALGGTTSLTGGAITVTAGGTLNVTTLSQTGADQALTLQADTLQLPGSAFSVDTGTANLSLRSLVAPMTTTGTLAGQDVTLQGGAGLSVANAITARGQLTLLSGSGPITQTAPLTVAGTTTVDAGSGDITITHTGNSLAQAVSLSGANTLIASSGALTLGTLATGNLDATAHGALTLGHGTVGGTLSANSNGNPISQAAGGLDVTGASTITAGAGSITLTDAANNFQAAVNLSGASTQITAANALTLGTVNTGDLIVASHGALNLGKGTVTGALNANSNGGDFTQSTAGTDSLTVTGTTALNAGVGNITLDQVGNDFQGAVSLTGAATQLTDANALTLGTVNTGALMVTSHGALNLGKGTLSSTVNAYSNGGAITQSTTLPGDNLNIGGATMLDAGGIGTITLAQAGNDFHSTVSLTGAATQLTDANALTLNFVNTGDLIVTSHGTLNLGKGTLTGTLTASSNGGAIVQAASVPSDHLAVLGATVLDAGSGTITLTRAGNDFQSAVSLTGAATQVNDVNALTLGTVNTGDLTVTSHGLLNLGRGTVAGNLDANSNGNAIAQSTAGSDHLTVSGTTALNAGVGTVTLTQAGNDFTGAVSLTGAATQVTDANALTLGTVNTGDLSLISGGALNLGHGSVAGSLNATSNGNAITQGSGGLTVTGVATVTAGTSTVNLTDAANDFQASVGLTGSALQITSAHALTLGPVNTGSLAATSTGALNLGSGTVTGDLSANSHGGDITQAGALTVGGNAALAAGSGNITLTNAGNDFQGAVNLSGASAQLVDANALTLGQLASGNLGVTAHGALNLGQGTVTGTLTADSQGNTITQSSGGLNVSGVTTITAGVGSITLDQPANQFQSTVNLSGGNTQLANAGALTLGAVNTGSLSVAAAGDLNLGSGSVGGALDASSQGNALTQAGALTVAGATTLTADGHALQVTLDQAANQFTGGVLLAASHGGAISTAAVQSNQALAIAGAANTLNASSGDLLTLGAGQYTSLNATAVAGVAQSGALNVSGTTTLAANGGVGMPVTLTNTGNDLHAVQLLAQNGGSLGTVRLVDGDGQRADGLQAGGQAADLGLTSAGALTLGAGSYGSLAADTSAHGAAITQTGAITVAGSTVLNSGAGDISLNLPGNDLNSLSIVAARAANVQDVNDLVVSAAQTSQQLALSAPGQISVTGPVTGAGALVMNGSGTLLIQAALAYSGGTQANTGTVVLDGPAAQAGSGGTVVLGAGGRLDLRNGATLGNPLLSQGGSLANTVGAGTVAGAVTLAADTTVEAAASATGLTLAGAIGDAGNHHGLALGGGGVLTLAGSNDYSGATQVHAGTLVAQGTGALPSSSAVTVDAGATLQLAQAQSVGSLAGGGQVDLQGFSLSTGLDNTSTTFSGGLSGSGGLTKLGSGTFTLAGQNTATGATQVNTGRLVLAGGAALADSSAVTVAAGATLQLASSETIGSLAGAGTVDLQAQRLSAGGDNSNTEFAGTLIGTGGLSKQGSGTLSLSGSGNYSGDTLVQAGTLRLAQTPVQSEIKTVSVAAGAVLDLQSDAQVDTLAGAGQVQLNSHTLTTGGNNSSSQFAGSLTGAGGLVKTGSGNLALSGSNAYTGDTTLSAGTLTLSGGSALADQTAVTVATGARLVVAGDETVGSLAGAGDVALTGHSLATGANGNSTRFDGVISGDGGLTKVGAGSMTLAGANTYSGTTLVQAGTLRVGDGGTHGQLGTGAVDNRAALVFDRSDALTVDNAITGSGSLTQLQGQLTLTSTANQYTGATTVSGGTLATSGAERLPDGSAVHVAAGGHLALAGNETVASINADGAVTAAGDIHTAGDQVYVGTLTLTNPQGTQLTAQQITANNTGNQFGTGTLSITAANAQLTAAQDLVLGDVSLANGGQVTADRLALNGALVVNGGSLGLTATATPDVAKATVLGNAQVPVVGKTLAQAETTVLQGAAGSINVASGASLNVAATGGGSVILAQDANRFTGGVSVLSGAQFNTAWQPNVQGTVGVQSMVDVAGSQVVVGGAGIEGDMVHIRADQLSTSGTAQLAARLPFDEVLLGTSLSAPSMTLELAPAAFQQTGSFGQTGGQEVRVAVGARDIGGRTDGLNAGFLTIRPKNGAQGSTAVFLVGPGVTTQVGGYRFFHDGAGQQTEVPVFYNGVMPMTPQVTGALSSIDGDAEDARRAKFQETVRTENVTIRLRAGVIAEVGPGRPATQGSDGARPPEACEPAAGKGLTCP